MRTNHDAHPGSPIRAAIRSLDPRGPREVHVGRHILLAGSVPVESGPDVDVTVRPGGPGIPNVYRASLPSAARGAEVHVAPRGPADAAAVEAGEEVDVQVSDAELDARYVFEVAPASLAHALVSDRKIRHALVALHPCRLDTEEDTLVLAPPLDHREPAVREAMRLLARAAAAIDAAARQGEPSLDRHPEVVALRGKRARRLRMSPVRIALLVGLALLLILVGWATRHR